MPKEAWGMGAASSSGGRLLRTRATKARQTRLSINRKGNLIL